MYKVLIVGNPNCGKTSLLNALSNQRFKVSNWPGTTVERAEAVVEASGIKMLFIDTPGIYDLNPHSLDENVAVNEVLQGEYDCILYIADGRNLQRSLFLLLEIREKGIPVFLVINKMDDLSHPVDDNALEVLKKAFNLVDAVLVSAAKKINIDILKEKLAVGIKSLQGGGDRHLPLKVDYLEDVNALLDRHSEHRWQILKGFSGEGGEACLPEDIEGAMDETKRHILNAHQQDMESFIYNRRYGFIKGLLAEIFKSAPTLKKEALSDLIDSVVLNRVLGLPIFLAVMYLLFNAVFVVADPLVGLLEGAISGLSNILKFALVSINAPQFLTSLAVDGIVAGLGNVLTFLPSIFVLFFLISLLEESGYLARVAFLMDRVMHIFGLHGKSFVCMLLGFGCTIPAVLSTRILSNAKDRIVTILILPFISCSARLPICVLFASVFFPKHSGLVVFCLYLLSVFVALVNALVLNKLFFAKDEGILVMEMPPYAAPNLRAIFHQAAWQTGHFIKKAGTTILLGVVFIWLLASLPLGVEYASKASLLGRIGEALAPLFAPAGFGFWQAAVALVSGIVAKELVVGTLGTLLAGAQDGALRTVLPFSFSTLGGLSFMLMSLLYTPCLPTIGAIKKEIGARWAIFSFVFNFMVAYIVSIGVYQLARHIFGAL